VGVQSAGHVLVSFDICRVGYYAFLENSPRIYPKILALIVLGTATGYN